MILSDKWDKKTHKYAVHGGRITITYGVSGQILKTCRRSNKVVVIKHAVEQPVHGQHRTGNGLRKQGVCVSGSGVHSIWLRHTLKTSQNFKNLEEKVANEGIILTEATTNSMKELQKDLGKWIDYYNNRLTHQSKMCSGRSLFKTLIDGKLI